MECNYALLIEHKQVCRKSIDILKENIHCVSWIFRIGLVLPFLCVYFCFHGFPKQNLLLNITKDNSSSSFLVLWQMMRKFCSLEKGNPLSQQLTSVLNSVAVTDVVLEWSCVKSQKTGSDVEFAAKQKWKRREYPQTTLTDVDIWQWYDAIFFW